MYKVRYIEVFDATVIAAPEFIGEKHFTMASDILHVIASTTKKARHD